MWPQANTSHLSLPYTTSDKWSQVSGWISHGIQVNKLLMLSNHALQMALQCICQLTRSSQISQIPDFHVTLLLFSWSFTSSNSLPLTDFFTFSSQDLIGCASGVPGWQVYSNIREKASTQTKIHKEAQWMQKYEVPWCCVPPCTVKTQDCISSMVTRYIFVHYSCQWGDLVYSHYYNTTMTHFGYNLFHFRGYQYELPDLADIHSDY